MELSIDTSNLTLLVMSMIAIITVILWHKSDDDFRLQQMLLDSVTKKISVEKVGYLTALFIGTWGLVALIQQGKMTEGYFLGYLSIFALSRAASMGLSVTKDVKSLNKGTEVPTKE